MGKILVGAVALVLAILIAVTLTGKVNSLTQRAAELEQLVAKLEKGLEPFRAEQDARSAICKALDGRWQGTESGAFTPIPMIILFHCTPSGLILATLPTTNDLPVLVADAKTGHITVPLDSKRQYSLSLLEDADGRRMLVGRYEALDAADSTERRSAVVRLVKDKEE